LLPSNSYSFNIRSTLNINFDITADDCCNKEIFNKTLPHLSPISLSQINLDSLRYSSHQMDNLKDEINKIQSESHIVKYGTYYSAITYILIVSLFVYCIVRLYKYYKSRKVNDSGCCIQIFNQCHNNKKVIKRNSKFSNSIEMTDISSASDDDNKSIKSLPAFLVNHKSYDSLKKVDFAKSNRNLNF
jgi:hypothetical protein